jgi:hypothetical protein
MLHVFRGLDMEVLLSKKVVFLEGDTSQAHLGLGEEIYEEVCPCCCRFDKRF